MSLGGAGGAVGSGLCGDPWQGPRGATLAEDLSWLCTAEAYVRSVLFCLGIFLSFYILTLLIACWESCR